MTALTMTYRNGETLTWTNGVVTGSPVRLAQLELAKGGTGLVTPEGPQIPLESTADPQAFLLLANRLGRPTPSGDLIGSAEDRGEDAR